MRVAVKIQEAELKVELNINYPRAGDADKEEDL